MGEEHLMSCHSKSEEGENDFSAEARISPILTVPKNPVVAAAQITCLSRAGQEVAAILLPRVIFQRDVTPPFLNRQVHWNRFSGPPILGPYISEQSVRHYYYGQRGIYVGL